MPSITGKFILELRPSQSSSGNIYFLLMSSGAAESMIVDASDFRSVAWIQISSFWTPEFK